MRNIIVLALLLLATLFEPSFLLDAQQRNRSRNPGKRPTNHPPVITSVDTSSTKILLCRWDQAGICTLHPDGILELSVSAKDQDGDKLLYKYSVTGGRIEGEGPRVTWNLGDVPVGVYIAQVIVSDPLGAIATGSTSVKIEICGACDGPPCPT